jgi:hypothetical protein
MPLDFDPVFHTETMVKILREQGSTQYAMELAELILQKNPDHAGVRRILEELREEARRAFERFKNSGRPAEPASEAVAAESMELGGAVAEPPAQPGLDEAEMESSAPEFAAELEAVDAAVEVDGEPLHLTLVPPPPPLSRREAKVRRLQALLSRVQSARKAADAPQT